MSFSDALGNEKNGQSRRPLAAKVVVPLRLHRMLSQGAGMRYMLLWREAQPLRMFTLLQSVCLMDDRAQGRGLRIAQAKAHRAERGAARKVDFMLTSVLAEDRRVARRIGAKLYEKTSACLKPHFSLACVHMSPSILVRRVDTGGARFRRTNGTVLFLAWTGPRPANGLPTVGLI